MQYAGTYCLVIALSLVAHFLIFMINKVHHRILHKQQIYAQICLKCKVKNFYSCMVLCVPSHIGRPFDCWHPHACIVESLSKGITLGVIPDPLWEPSQYGPFFELPHIQKAIVSPDLGLISNGLFCQPAIMIC